MSQALLLYVLCLAALWGGGEAGGKEEGRRKEEEEVGRGRGRQQSIRRDGLRHLQHHNEE